MSAASQRQRAAQLFGSALALMSVLAAADITLAAGTVVTPAQPAPSSATEPKEKATAPGTRKPPSDTLEALDSTAASGVLGSKVQSPSGEDMGLVVDVVVDKDGRPRALVIDFGGFLGVGSRKIAVDWRLVQFSPKGDDAPVRVQVGRQDLQGAPGYDPAAKTNKIIGPAVVVHPSPTDAGD